MTVAREVLTALSGRAGATSGALATAALFAERVEDPELLAKAGGHPNATAELLTHLAGHPSAEVRATVVTHPSTPFPVVEGILSRERTQGVLRAALRCGRVADVAARRLPALSTKSRDQLVAVALERGGQAFGELELLLSLLPNSSGRVSGASLAQQVRDAGWDYQKWCQAGAPAIAGWGSDTVADTCIGLIGAWDADADAALARQAVELRLVPLHTSDHRPDAEQFIENQWAHEARELLRKGRPALALAVAEQVAARAHQPALKPDLWEILKQECGVDGSAPAVPDTLPPMTYEQAVAVAQDPTAVGLPALAALTQLAHPHVDPSLWQPLANRNGRDGFTRSAILTHADTLPDLALAALVGGAGPACCSQLTVAQRRRVAVTLLHQRGLLPQNLFVNLRDIETHLELADVLAAPLPTVVQQLTGTVALPALLDEALAEVTATAESRELFLAIADTHTGTVGELVTAIRAATA